MARNRDPFTQALTSLRDRIQSGALAGGTPVIVQDEARRLGLSTTPVREALARLSGEGLVERAAPGGYVTPRLDATAARDRYAMRGEYIRIALGLNRAALGAGRPPPGPWDPAAPGLAVHRLLAMIVCSAGNQVLWSAFEQVTGQLKVLSRFEPELFSDFEAEAEALHLAYGSDTPEAFEERIGRFHTRRIAAAAALTALVRLPRPEASRESERNRPAPGFTGRP